jgi:hypothetical protein
MSEHSGQITTGPLSAQSRRPQAGWRLHRWTLATVVLLAPILVTLVATIWRTPFPLSEAVALFEDVSREPPLAFLVPDTSYYRPLFHLSLAAIWTLDSTEARLAAVKVLHLVPVCALMLLVVWHWRPVRAHEAAAALVAGLVVVGSPGFRDNLELPLAYTAVGMPLGWAAWMLVERARRAWTTGLVLLLTLIAVGFKEQGLVIVPVVVVAWWMGAPGASRTLVITLVMATLVYLGLRLQWRGAWPLFEQAMGLGFTEIEPAEAIARFGRFPYGIYAYNAASTAGNLLFSEPTRGRFVITEFLVQARPWPWAMNHLLTSVSLTGLIAWWAVPRLVGDRRQGTWSTDSRLAVATAVAVLACGALSFNYSRDRLGGMAVPFYAASAYSALCAFLNSWNRRTGRHALAGALLVLGLSIGWPLRALGTLEFARRTSLRNQIEWLTEMPSRRLEFAERPEYLATMGTMIAQGTAAGVPEPTAYPTWFARALLEP